jgi:Domain of unknown function (DUF4333)
MTESRTLRRWAAPLVVALCLPGAGCAGAVRSGEVEASITAELHRLGIDADDIRCPGDLPAVIGEDVRCSFVVAGQPVDAVATVVAINSGRARFSIKTEPHPIDRALLERRLAGEIPQHAGGIPASVVCDADLTASVGEVETCALGANRRVVVRVTAVRGGEIDYSVLEL